MRLTLKSVPARQGLIWVRDGLSEFVRHPLGYASLFVAFMFVASLAAALPGVGGILLLIGMPLLSLAYMMASLGSQRGAAPRLVVFAAPWRQLPPTGRRNLLVLCLSYALVNLLAMGLCDLLDGGALERLIDAYTGGEATPEEIQRLAEAPGVLTGALARLVATMLLSVPYWHAPALVCWCQQGVGQALFSSVLALWQTRAAFVVYSLGWLGVVLGASSVTGLLLALLNHPSAAGLLVMPVALGLTCAYYVSLFSTFRDSFGHPEAPLAGGGSPPSTETA